MIGPTPRLLSCALLLAFAGCANPVDIGSSEAALAGDVMLCVDTIDCGGICGTEREVRRFLADCQGNDEGPGGPCFNRCWSACRHSGERSGRLVACTEECRILRCPADAARGALVRTGHFGCPSPAPDTICFMLYAPVDCGGCIYSNGCFAAAAGFVDGQCRRLSDDRIFLLE